MSRLKALTKEDYLYALIPAGIALVVYILTVCPTVFSEDCGEFVFGSYTMGVFHAPGYPTYGLLGHLFSYLPFKTVPWRVNFLSGFCTASAVYFLYLCGRKFGLHSIAIGSACLGLAFSKNVWSQSVVAEVYAPHLFFVCVEMFLFLQWARCRESKFIYLFSLIYGLSLGNHQVIGMFIPFYVLVILLCDPKFFPKIIIGVAISVWLGTVFGGLIHLLVPLELNVFFSFPISGEMQVSILTGAVLFFIFLYLMFRRNEDSIFALPGYLFYPKRFWISLLVFAVGISVYLYLPIRANAKPFLNWGNPYNWENFWFHVRRSVYNPDIKMTLTDYLERLKVLWYYLDLLVTDFTWIYFFLGLFGIYHFMKKNFKWALFTLCLFLIGGLGLVIIHKSSLTANTKFVIRVFYFQSYAPFVLFSAFGIELFLDKIKKLFHLRVLPNWANWSYYTAAAMLPFIPLTSNWSYNDLSENTFCYDYAKAIMDTMEPNAIMYAAGDMVIFNLVYLQLVEKYRLDITVYDNFSVFHDNYMGFDFYKGIIPDPEEERIRQRTYAKTIDKEYGKRPIYFYNGQYLRYKTDFVTIPVGLIYQAHKKSDPLPKIKDWWNIYDIRGISNEEFYNDERVNPFITDFHLRKARYYINAKQPQKVADEYAIVEKTKNLNGMTEVALYWLNHNNAPYALSLLRETLRVDESLHVNRYNKGLALTALKEPELAVESFQAFLKHWQGESRYYEDAYRRMRTLENKPLAAQDLNNIGIRYMWKGEYQKAMRLFEEGIKVKPTNPLILLNMAISYEQLKDIAKSGYYYQNFLNIWKGEAKYTEIARKGLERLRSQAGLPIT